MLKLRCYVLTLLVIAPASNLVSDSRHLLLIILDFVQESCFKALSNLWTSFISASMIKTCSDTELILNTSKCPAQIPDFDIVFDF